MSPLKIKSPIRFIAALIVLAAVNAVYARPGASCIYFESPLTEAVFSAPSCTVSLNVECSNVIKVDLQARYVPENSDSAVIISLGSISRPPYKLIWNTQNLPNQLFTGISILAEATISGSEPQIALQEGIFLTHNPIKRKMIPIPYSQSATNLNNSAAAQTFNIDDPQKSGRGVIVWNEKELIVEMAVKDPTFYSNQPGRNMSEAGLEVLIDPARGRSPYPTDNTLFFMVPLSGAPYRINYRAETADGAFRLVPQSARVDYTHNTVLGEFRGYSVRLHIPREAFGRTIPDTISANMVLRILDDSGNVQRIPLDGESIFEIYSPFSWSDYYKLPKPLIMNAVFHWVIFPLAGFLLALLVYVIISKLRKPQLLSNFERSEEEKDIFEKVNKIIERELVKKDLKINDVASQCGLTPQALNILLKHNTGFNFISYLQFCRTEVAKERLRSSRSSEKSIADLCGFASPMEMEKCFSKFHRTTPYKFRSKQQVA